MAALPYLLYPPRVADTRPDRPLIVFLHGSGERGADLELVKNYGLPRQLEGGLELSAFVVAPQCPLGSTWEDQLGPLESLIEALLRQHPVSRERISLTGFSMGGFGVWRWALSDPRRFAGVMPVAGSAAAAETFGLAGQADSLGELPIWIVHGAADRHVPVRGADECAAVLQERNARYRYRRYPDADHGETCRRAYADPELLHWLVHPQAPVKQPG